MIAQDFLRGAQCKIFIISLVMIITIDIFRLILTLFTILSFNLDDKLYDTFYQKNILIFILFFLTIQIPLFFILFIMSITCWKGNFFLKILETQSQRFLLISDLLIVNLIVSSLGIYSYILLRDEINLREKLSDPQMDKIQQLKIENKAALIISVAQIFSLILFIIGLIITYKNRSDQAIIENEGGYGEDFQKLPQKTVFIISLILIIISTFAQSCMSSYHVKKCKPKFSFDYCFKNDDCFCWDNFHLFIYLLIIGGIQFLFFSILLIISKTCFKGKFLLKILENQIKTYSIVFVGTIIYIFGIIFGILVFLNFIYFQNNENKAFKNEKMIYLSFSLAQCFSLILFFLLDFL